jgi:hypothetical protein
MPSDAEVIAQLTRERDEANAKAGACREALAYARDWVPNGSPAQRGLDAALATDAGQALLTERGRLQAALVRTEGHLQRREAWCEEQRDRATKAEARVAECVSVLRAIEERGHYDTCDEALGDYPCSCPHALARAALAGGGGE